MAKYIVSWKLEIWHTQRPQKSMFGRVRTKFHRTGYLEQLISEIINLYPSDNTPNELDRLRWPQKDRVPHISIQMWDTFFMICSSKDREQKEKWNASSFLTFKTIGLFSVLYILKAKVYLQWLQNFKDLKNKISARN